MNAPLLVFTTDFGLADPYAGVMKGVVLSINPAARFIDLTHQISPQDILHGSFLLGVSYRYFPVDAIHIVVVDPGVGTSRRPVLLRTPHGSFVAPDNGVLSQVLARYTDNMPGQPGAVAVPAGLSAYHLTNEDYWRHPVSATFHGRDVFAPVAAHLSLGARPQDLGEPVDELVWRPIPEPHATVGGIDGVVLFQDVYGNLTTNIRGDALAGWGEVSVTIKGEHIPGLSRTFYDPAARPGPRGLVALIGSHGYLEVVRPGGNAAETLAAEVGAAAVVTFPAHAETSMPDRMV